MSVPRPAPIIAQLPDGTAWAIYNCDPDSPLYWQTFRTRREAAAALIFERTKQVMEKGRE